MSLGREAATEGPQGLRRLEGALSDSRSVLRRAGRLQRSLGECGDPGLERLAAACVEAAQELLAGLEVARAEERRRTRELLRPGLSEPPD